MTGFGRPPSSHSHQIAARFAPAPWSSVIDAKTRGFKSITEKPPAARSSIWSWKIPCQPSSPSRLQTRDARPAGTRTVSENVCWPAIGGQRRGTLDVDSASRRPSAITPAHERNPARSNRCTTKGGAYARKAPERAASLSTTVTACCRRPSPARENDLVGLTTIGYPSSAAAAAASEWSAQNRLGGDGRPAAAANRWSRTLSTLLRTASRGGSPSRVDCSSRSRCSEIASREASLPGIRAA